jgi:hypothetical protein
MALYIPHSIFHLARLLYVRPETFETYYVFINFWMRHTKFSFKFITIFDSKEIRTIYVHAIFRHVRINNEKCLLAVCLSVRMCQAAPTEGIFVKMTLETGKRKSVEKLHTLLKPDKNIRQSTWRPKCILYSICSVYVH